MADSTSPAISNEIPEPVPETLKKIMEGTPKKIPRKIREKIPDDRPDMDPLEWAKKHIEIPEMKARVVGLYKLEGEPGKKIRHPAILKKGPVAHPAHSRKAIRGTDFTGRNSSTEATISQPVKPVERKSELNCTDYYRKKGRKLLNERAKLALFTQLKEEIALLRLMIDDLRFRLDDIEEGRRSV